MKRLLTIALILAVGFASSPASAIGENEETALQVLGLILVTDKIKDIYEKQASESRKSESSEEQIRRAYEAGAKRRRMEELETAKRKAFECGYSSTGCAF